MKRLTVLIALLAAVGSTGPAEGTGCQYCRPAFIVGSSDAVMDRFNQGVRRPGTLASESVEIHQRGHRVTTVPQVPHLFCKAVYGDIATALRPAPRPAEQHRCSVDPSALKMDRQHFVDELFLGFALDAYAQTCHVTVVRRTGSSARARRR